jgi:hypothetical protein
MFQAEGLTLLRGFRRTHAPVIIDTLLPRHQLRAINAIAVLSLSRIAGL